MKHLLLFLYILVFTTFGYSAFAQSGPVSFTLEDLDGNEVSLNDFTDKGPVYITFWALWCQPCLHKMRLLNNIYNDYKDDGFTLLAINIDDQNSVARVRGYINSQGYNFPVLYDPGEQVFEQLNGRTLPYALMVDTEGNIVQVDTGFLPGDELKIKEKVQSLLVSE